jgi:hypothetical protein
MVAARSIRGRSTLGRSTRGRWILVRLIRGRAARLGWAVWHLRRRFRSRAMRRPCRRRRARRRVRVCHRVAPGGFPRRRSRRDPPGMLVPTRAPMGRGPGAMWRRRRPSIRPAGTRPVSSRRSAGMGRASSRAPHGAVIRSNPRLPGGTARASFRPSAGMVPERFRRPAGAVRASFRPADGAVRGRSRPADGTEPANSPRLGGMVARARCRRATPRAVAQSAAMPPMCRAALPRVGGRSTPPAVAR